MNNIRYTFSKSERLKSKKEISRIFNDGIFFYSDVMSLGVIKSCNEKQIQHKIAISVPKKIFKLAVTRNRVKRQIREAYRLNKHILYSNSEVVSVYNMMFIYKNKSVIDYSLIESKIIELLKKVNN